MKAREPKIYHIKVDWETHQIYMKYRDKLSRLMAGPDRFSERWLITQADYKGWRALKSCHSEFHRILWCGPIKKRLSRKSFTLQSLSFCMCARLYRNKKISGKMPLIFISYIYGCLLQRAVLSLLHHFRTCGDVDFNSTVLSPACCGLVGCDVVSHRNALCG